MYSLRVVEENPIKTQKVGDYPSTAFYSGFAVKLDAKSRIVVPAKLRQKGDGGSFVMALQLESEKQCVLLFRQADWEARSRQFRDLKNAKPQWKSLLETVNKTALDCPYDGVGRMVVPEFFLRILHNGRKPIKEFMFAGWDDHIEMWRADDYQKYHVNPESDEFAEMIQQLSADDLQELGY